MTTDIQALRALVDKMTPGPWCVFRHFDAPTDRMDIVGQTRDDDVVENVLPNDAAAIVALRNAAPGLLDEVERLQEALVEVVRATRAYLPPGGITAQECLNRVLGATDNPKINPILLAALGEKP